jgi:hypothetical protein
MGRGFFVFTARCARGAEDAEKAGWFSPIRVKTNLLGSPQQSWLIIRIAAGS